MAKPSDHAHPSEGKEKMKTKFPNLSRIALDLFGKGEAGEAHLVWWLITRMALVGRSWVRFPSGRVRSPQLGDSPAICSL